jgi:hypothetical protein
VLSLLADPVMLWEIVLVTDSAEIQPQYIAVGCSPWRLLYLFPETYLFLQQATIFRPFVDTPCLMSDQRCGKGSGVFACPANPGLFPRPLRGFAMDARMLSEQTHAQFANLTCSVRSDKVND